MTERAEDPGTGEGHRPHPPHQGGRASDPPGGAPMALGLQRALTWCHRQRACRPVRRSERLDPGRQGVHLQRARRLQIRPEHRVAGRRRAHRASRPPEGGRPVGGRVRRRRPGEHERPGHRDRDPPRGRAANGPSTSTSVCIGCKAWEVACKQWDALPADGSQSGKGVSDYYTGDLPAWTWRHVRFVELFEPSTELGEEARRALDAGAGGKLPAIPAACGLQRPCCPGGGGRRGPRRCRAARAGRRGRRRSRAQDG